MLIRNVFRMAATKQSWVGVMIYFPPNPNLSNAMRALRIEMPLSVLVSMTSFTRRAFRSDLIHNLLDFVHGHRFTGLGTNAPDHLEKVTTIIPIAFPFYWHATVADMDATA
jgi:hypothetical protein